MAFRRLLRMASRRPRNETPAGPAKHPNSSAQCTTSSIALDHLKTHLDHKHAEMTNNNVPLFTGSQLCRAEFTDGALVDAVDIAFCDGDVQRAAAEALAKLTALNDVIGLRSEIARGIDAAMGAARDISQVAPEAVVHAIKRRTAEVEDALAAAKADKLTHNAVNKARRNRLAALNNAVNKASANLSAERDHLLRQIDSFKWSGGAADANEKRVRQLREIGLSVAEINSLNIPLSEDREATEKAARERITAIDTLLPKCKAFWADPWRCTAVLTGLGLDVEVDAFEAARREPYTTEALQA